MNTLTILIGWILTGLIGYFVGILECKHKRWIAGLCTRVAGNYIWKSILGPIYLLYRILKYGDGQKRG